jgi:dTDP-4-dehydrorhamnose reductase
MTRQKTVLITGAYGQLGRELANLLQSGGPGDPAGLPASRDTLDITDCDAVLAFCRARQPDAIVNCAAYTAVDTAESRPETAFAVNEQGVRNLSLAAAQQNIALIHISTDFVFDGQKSSPYNEDDLPNPLGVYGRSKLAGESTALQTHAKTIVIRTGWLYSPYGKNFVKTILAAARKHGRLSVVADQVGTPTYAADLARAVIEILPRAHRGYGQIFHYANQGVASWYDFATAAVSFAKIACTITPVETSAYPTAAARPAYSVLNKKKIQQTFGLTATHWTVPLKQYIKNQNTIKS